LPQYPVKAGTSFETDNTDRWSMHADDSTLPSMATLLIVTEQPFRVTEQGFSASTPWDDDLAQTFGPAFTEKTVVGTVALDEIGDDKYVPVSHAFSPEPLRGGRWTQLRSLWELVGKSDVVYAKLFTTLGIAATVFACLRRRPCATILVGDAAISASLRTDVVDNQVARRAASIIVHLAVIVSQNLATAPGYVARPLRKRYPTLRCRHWVANESWTKLDEILPSDQYERPRSGSIIFVGRLVNQKGIRELIGAIATLNASGTECTLDVVGTGRDEESARSLAQELSVAQHIKFHGWIESGSPDLRSLLRTTRVLCLPSYSEGTALVLIEAAAAGVPIVATDVGGTADLLEGSGWLVPPQDEELLTNALRTALTDEDQWTRSRQQLEGIARRNCLEVQRGRIGGHVSSLLRQ
jgi:glycosyltransferase involved in cell wall biosynthesis